MTELRPQRVTSRVGRHGRKWEIDQKVPLMERIPYLDKPLFRQFDV